MAIEEIVAKIDIEIANLIQVRNLLANEQTKPAGRRGRPRKNPLAVVISPNPKGNTKRTISAAGRARIAAAQKARWSQKKRQKTESASTPTAVAAKTESAKKPSPKKQAPKKVDKSPKAADKSKAVDKPKAE